MSLVHTAATLAAAVPLLAWAVAEHRSRLRARTEAAALPELRAEMGRLREALEDRERRLAQAQRLAGLGTWEWTLSGPPEDWPHEALRLLSLLPGDAADAAAGSLMRVHPDDRERLRAALVDSLTREEPLDLEFRTMRPDGSVRHLNARAEVLHGGDGAHRLIGTVLDITDFRRAEEALRRLASIDSLTGAYTRRYFFELGRQELEKWRRYGHPLGAMMLDLDGFKQVNDRHGHAAGDRLLRAVARTARESLRRADILGRYGGDELAVLLPQSGLEQARETAERLRARVAAQRIPLAGGAAAVVTVSIGVSEAQEGDADIAAVLKRADDALYAAKEGGRNRVCPPLVATA
jgi:diguanylate cyclase (GGDEF)-like protein